MSIDKLLTDFEARKVDEAIASKNRLADSQSYSSAAENAKSAERLRGWFRTSVSRGEITPNSPFGRDLMNLLDIRECRRFEERVFELTRPSGMVATEPERVAAIHAAAIDFMASVTALQIGQPSSVLDNVEERILSLVRFAVSRDGLFELR